MNTDIKISRSISEEHRHVSFYVQEGGYLSSAEMSELSGDIWIFSRLFVHRSMRGKGYASKLLDELLAFCLENKLTLMCSVDPDEGLNYQQLTDFYVRHGFSKTKHEDTLVFSPMGKKTTQFQSLGVGMTLRDGVRVEAVKCCDKPEWESIDIIISSPDGTSSTACCVDYDVRKDLLRVMIYKPGNNDDPAFSLDYPRVDSTDLMQSNRAPALNLFSNDT